MVMRDDFEQRAVGRRRLVEADSCLDRDFRCASAGSALSAFQERLQRRLSVYDIRQTLAEAVGFAGIQFQRAVQICKVERVQNDAGGVRESIRLVNVYAP